MNLPNRDDQFEQEWEAQSPVRILVTNGEEEGDPDDRTMVVHTDKPLVVTTLTATNNIVIYANAEGPDGKTAVEQAFMLTLSREFSRRLLTDLTRVLGESEGQP